MSTAGRTVVNRGLKDRARPTVSDPAALKRPHKYLADPLVVDEAPIDYVIEEGVLVDRTERPNQRKAYDEFTRFWPRTSDEYRIEEAAWAAKSGPCVIIKPGRGAA